MTQREEGSSKGPKEFYSAGLGDRLIDPAFFPVEVTRFLRDEHAMMEAIGPEIDLVVEIGCMQGRYLKWAAAHGKYYLGMDIVPRYINAGREAVASMGLLPQNYQFILGGAEQTAELVKSSQLKVVAQRCLVLFPFNSFGNMEHPLQVLQSVQKSGLPFLISSYHTSLEATECRRRYYEACGYEDVRCIKDGQGMRFVSVDGLCSMAYHPQHLQALFAAEGIPVSRHAFSQIGVAYMSPEISTHIAW